MNKWQYIQNVCTFAYILISWVAFAYVVWKKDWAHKTKPEDFKPLPVKRPQRYIHV